MSILDIAILFFVVLETGNVLILYFAPDSKQGNGVAIFDHWTHLKKDEGAHLFAQYMTNWVAGVKLIFIVLLLVIFFTADEATKFYSILVMIASIATYFWRLHPIIKKLDQMGHITPQGYSKKLGSTILGFLVMFSLAAALYLIIK